MKKFFLLISVFMCFISYSEEQIFLKVIKKEIKSQKSKINYSKEVNINIEEYDFYMNGEIIREYDSTKENNKKIYYVVGRYDVIVLNTLLDKILENDISEINSLKVSFSNKKNLDTDVFSVLKVTEEDFMINISINDENRYNINSLYEINYKGNEMILANNTSVYKSENIKELIKFLNENIEVNVLWYENFKEEL